MHLYYLKVVWHYFVCNDKDSDNGKLFQLGSAYLARLI